MKPTKKYIIQLFLLIGGAYVALGAVPQLTSQPVTIGDLRIRVLSNSDYRKKGGVAGYDYMAWGGNGTTRVKWYAPVDIWRDREEIGTWHDTGGNALCLAVVDALVPKFKRKHWYRAEIEVALQESARSFRGTEAELAEWKRSWGGEGKGEFFVAKNGKRYYVDFSFRRPVKDDERMKLIRTFIDNVRVASESPAKESGPVSMKWWTHENAQYRFSSNLPKTQGIVFIKKMMKVLLATRKRYESYVPPRKKFGVCAVRVFRNLVEYRQQRPLTRDADAESIGAWDTNKEELLLSSVGAREKFQTTMCHEAFHQYLHYATGRDDHAVWFDEGHACFFENVQYDLEKNMAMVTDSGPYADWVERDVERVARRLTEILRQDRDAFYCNNNPLARVNVHNRTVDAAYYNHVTAWALVYFLEKGAYADDDFAPYRKIVPTYLDAMSRGLKWDQATKLAWQPVAERDLAVDFLVFWEKFRTVARDVRKGKIGVLMEL